MSESVAKHYLKSVPSSASVSAQKPVVLLEIEPHRCRPWACHNRDKAWFNIEDCRDLIESIQNNGQIEPVILRALPQGFDKDFEIIAGVRRWYSCLQIPHQKLLARVIEADDRACMILMHIENAHAQDISDFERASSFMQHMQSGVFKSQTDLGNAMGVSQSMICKMLAAAALFEQPWLSELFENKREIPIRKAYRLATLLKKPALYAKIQAEVARLLEDKKKTRLKVPASKMLQGLIHCAKATESSSAQETQEQVLFKKGEKAMVVAKKDQSGNFSLNFDRGLKSFDADQIVALCVQAVQGYFRGEKQGI
jgi:ParB family transcriptional regulator, chromosome partitioning protein